MTPLALAAGGGFLVPQTSDAINHHATNDGPNNHTTAATRRAHDFRRADHDLHAVAILVMNVMPSQRLTDRVDELTKRLNADRVNMHLDSLGPVPPRCGDGTWTGARCSPL